MLSRHVAGTGLAVLMMAWACGPADAGLLTSVNTGLGGQYQGTIRYNLPYVSANVDYGVFAPGMFPFTPANGLVIPANQYVYAFQILSLTPGTIPSWAYVGRLSVGLDGNEQVGVVGYAMEANSPPPGQLAPTIYQVVNGNLSVGWTFSPALSATSSPVNRSPYLFFTSPFSPETAAATLSGVSGQTLSLPSPTPEPASLALLVLGGGVLALRRRARR